MSTQPSLLDLVFKKDKRQQENEEKTRAADKGGQEGEEGGDGDDEDDEDENRNAIETKEEFISCIREWVILDKQLRLVQDKSRELRQKKTVITDRLCEFMEDKNIADKPIQISGQGQLQLVERRDYSSLTFSYVEERLAEIIDDEDQIDYIVRYLRDHREINVYSDLKLASNKR
jgi:hypothetical protein